MREWARYRAGGEGVELLDAFFERHVYERHMHESYAIGVTLGGVQRFWCRGATHDSTRGHVLVIHPGEAHDGRSGAAGGFAYRMLYVAPERMRSLAGDLATRAPVLRDAALARALDTAWRAMQHDAHSLAAGELLVRALVQLATRHGGRATRTSPHVDAPALHRVRDYLHAHYADRVRLDDLAALASMSRFQLTRQFQKTFGVPLHAYHLHVRLLEAKRRLRLGAPVAAVAAELGFADQSHLHRRFKGTFGVTPGEWRRAASDGLGTTLAGVAHHG